MAKARPSGGETPGEGAPYGEASRAGASAAAEGAARCLSASSADGRWWLGARCDAGGGDGEGVGDSLRVIRSTLSGRRAYTLMSRQSLGRVYMTQSGEPVKLH